jgi:DNA-binding NarL/FixJ family response regulator
LEGDSEVHVVAESPDVGSLSLPFEPPCPDCVVVGAGGTAPVAVAGLRAAVPDARVVLVVTAADAPGAHAALAAGASGFINRDALDRAPAVVRAVTAGTVVLPPLLAASLRDAPEAATGGALAVLEHLAAGRGYRDAAEDLGLDPAEAKALVARVVDRVQAGAAPAAR